jgi:hypothetical protein
VLDVQFSRWGGRERDTGEGWGLFRWTEHGQPSRAESKLLSVGIGPGCSWNAAGWTLASFVAITAFLRTNARWPGFAKLLGRCSFLCEG